MEIKLKFSDQVYREDKDFVKFFEALQQMLDRMGTSHFKYGTMRDANTHGDVDAVLTARQRLTMYDGVGRQDACDSECVEGDHSPSCFLVRKHVPSGGTGNTENLLDAANCLIIGHLFPKHPKAHFKAQTSADSPGLARK